LKLAYLGSGSKGNSALFEAAGTCVMLDCGFTLREADRRMARLGFSPQDLAGVLVTHEHSDHFAGVARLARRHSIPVWLTHGTARGGDLEGVDVRWVNAHESFTVGALSISPMPVPHDAREPCQYVFSDGEKRAGVLTDVGHATPHIIQSLGGVDVLLLECNHDLEMLMNGPYPHRLKRRVKGALGHLSNCQAAQLLGNLDQTRLRQIFALHLSDTNNTPALAKDALAEARSRAGIDIEIVDQEAGLAWYQL
jgi:phosphoribosyl 1,2-cyclic phosphodiesterase